MAEGSSPPDFGKWFALADLDGDGQISGQEAIPFFTKFDALVKKDLIECWEIADEHKNGFLTLKEFIVAMGVVSLKQAGVKITSARSVVEKRRVERVADAGFEEWREFRGIEC